MEVWGTGEATAERWYRDGCRSLEDVQGRSDLSMQQVGILIGAESDLEIGPRFLNILIRTKAPPIVMRSQALAAIVACHVNTPFAGPTKRLFGID